LVSSYLLVQMSDIHLTSSGSLDPDLRPRDNLLRGLALLQAAGLRPDAFVLTGDLADAGEAACYDDLAAIVTQAAERSGAGVIYLPGNHDDRGMFRRHLAGGAGDGPLHQTCWRGGLRIIALDSTVPGESYGMLDEQALGYLRGELRKPAPHGTVVALHHPPVPSPIEPMARIALRDPGRLRDTIAGSDVRIVLCGHNHHAALGTLGPVPVWVSPAVAYRADVTRTRDFHRVPGAAFSRIDLPGGDGPTVTVIPIGAPPGP